MTIIEKILQIALGEEGYLEKASNAQLDDKTANAGSGNFTKYWRDMCPSFQGQAWCNCFVNWVFFKGNNEDKSKAKDMLYSKEFSYYTPTSASYFKNNNAWSSTPKVGDIIYFKNSQRIHHVGIVYKISSTMVYTVEGNTSAGTQVIPNGGAVCLKQYSLSNSAIAGYGRPKYGVSEQSYEVVDTAITTDRRGLEVLNELNVRVTPGGTIKKTLKKGDYIIATAKAKDEKGDYWFKTADGYISSKYVEGWIKEGNGLWWYIQKGYTYPKACIQTIDGKDYMFDRDGWMITSDRINSSGELKSV